jgi:hypothetical protein
LDDEVRAERRDPLPAEEGGAEAAHRCVRWPPNF